MKAAVLTIGDEILIGQIVNTNAAWMGEQLTGLGVTVTDMVTVGDEWDAIQNCLEALLKKCDIVLVTGGLGPTHDDITRNVVADLFDAELVRDERILAMVRDRWERRGKEMPPSNHSQAMVPDGFEAIVNEAGTAPLLIKQDGTSLLALLPGVPFEMKKLMQDTVLPRIGAMPGLQQSFRKTLHTIGIGESDLHDHLIGLEEMLDDTRSLAYLPNLSGLRMRMTATGEDAAERLEELENWIRERAAEWIFGEGDTSIEEELGKMLKARSLTLATAESCTGGFIAHKMTNVAGSSDYMRGGVVSYSNDVKVGVLGVDAGDIARHGAVSRQVAVQMAAGARSRLGADIGLSTTGIMGPGGGSPEKPVGTVWIGISTVEQTSAVNVQLGKGRSRNKERAVAAALNVLRHTLKKKGPEL